MQEDFFFKTENTERDIDERNVTEKSENEC